MDGGVFVADGPKGRQSETIHPEMQVQVGDREVRVARPSDAKRHKALHGLSRTLIANAVKGVSEGFTKKLEIRGVGYKAEMKGKSLVLALGYSHPIQFDVPTGIEIQVETPTLIAVRGVSRQQVGQVAADIRGFRPPEPYKGKGIRYEGEVVRQKAGKTAGK
jgi:large subunit ribosomal protein L6